MKKVISLIAILFFVVAFMPVQGFCQVGVGAAGAGAASLAGLSIGTISAIGVLGAAAIGVVAGAASGSNTTTTHH